MCFAFLESTRAYSKSPLLRTVTQMRMRLWKMLYLKSHSGSPSGGLTMIHDTAVLRIDFLNHALVLNHDENSSHIQARYIAW